MNQTVNPGYDGNHVKQGGVAGPLVPAPLSRRKAAAREPPAPATQESCSSRGHRLVPLVPGSPHPSLAGGPHVREVGGICPSRGRLLVTASCAPGPGRVRLSPTAGWVFSKAPCLPAGESSQKMQPVHPASLWGPNASAARRRPQGARIPGQLLCIQPAERRLVSPPGWVQFARRKPSGNSLSGTARSDCALPSCSWAGSEAGSRRVHGRDGEG